MSKKQIWIINEYAGSPYYGLGVRHYYLGKELVKLGYNVNIISSNYSHLFKNFPKPGKENIDGIDYFWIKTFNYGKAHSKKRVFKWFLFSLKLFQLPFKLEKPDIIITSSPSLFPVFPGWILSKFYRAKFVFEVRDIWPLTLIEVGGYSRNHPFIKIMKFFEILALKKADLIISNLPNYGEYLKDNNINRDFVWISNGINLEEMKEVKALPLEVIEKIPKDKFIIGYAGTIGTQDTLDSFLEASRFINKDDIFFVIVGNGQEKQRLQEIYKRDNIIFLNAIEKKQVQSILKLFDVCYIGWRDKNFYKYGISANKLFDYMYSGKPILHSFNRKGDIVQIVNCGITVKAENPEAIVDGIMKLYNMSKEERKKLGENGKNYVVRYFNYKELTKKLINEIRSL